jgi:dTDP-4-amino-4,6-dideoxygalactose transaminase
VDVPFLDLGAQMATIRPEVDAAIARVLDSTQFIMGEELTAFEREFATFCGTQECVGVDSGLSALELVLRAWGVGPGDEVITGAHTYIATVTAISMVGAEPVLVEGDPQTYLLDPRAIEAAITPRTRAIIPVHIYGQTVDMDPLMEVARRHNLLVLEDACQAHGARYHGRRAGSLGHAAAFSFYPGKNLGAAGDGGAITTDDTALAERLRMLRNYGQTVKYHHETLGFNHRLDSLQAAILRVKLQRLDEWNAGRRRVADTYLRELADLPLTLPVVGAGNEPVWHLFVVRAADRDAAQRQLREAGVDAGLHYPIPIHHQHAYPQFAGLRFPVSEVIAAECLSLPMYAEMTDAHIAAVAQALRAALAGAPQPTDLSATPAR